jgi:multiple sugar transport system substrate-binding protein
MPTINLTMAAHGPSWMEYIQKAIETFGRERYVSVKSEAYTWSEIWRKLVDISIHKSDVDVSEVGSTWIPSLVSMNALRPYQPADLTRLRVKANFPPATWQSTTVLGSDQVWAIPFAADVRVVYYWRDMLEQAGLDESKAFSTPDDMLNTMEQLKTVVPTPLVMQTLYNSRDTVFIAASWLWGAGIDFVSADGKSTLLNEPAAHQALQKHFQLARFLPNKEPISLQIAHDMFFNRQAAVTISGPWFASELWLQQESPSWSARLGVSSMPGPSFVGGTNLIIWGHSKVERESVQLIENLISPEVQNSLARFTTDLPVTRAAMETLMQTKVHAKAFVQSIETGRSLPAIPLWGLTEQRLTETFCRIWQELRESPETDIAELLSKRLPALARRLDVVLAGK